MITQNEKVLKHLRNHGYITQVIASNYGIRRCAARINDLKKTGLDIKSVRKTDDAGVPYAYYTLARKRAA